MLEVKDIQRHTDYGNYVTDRVERLLRIHNHYYSMRELAAGCQLPLTRHFRRHVNILAKYGVIEHFSSTDWKRRPMTVYAKKGSKAP